VTETNVFQLSQPGTFADPLTEVLRKGARALLAIAALYCLSRTSLSDCLTQSARG